MKRTSILLLSLTLCLLISFTKAAGYVPPYGGQNSSNSSYAYNGQQEANYTPPYEQASTYTPPSEQASTYTPPSEQASTYTPPSEQAPYGQQYATGSYYAQSNPTYEQQYQTYEQEQPNYYAQNYAGNASYAYGGNSSYGYGTEQAYNGSYNSSAGSPTTSPKFPTSLLTGFVVDVHFLAVDTSIQYIAYHYCSDLFPGYSQCAIYNGTDSNSRLVATELIVSAEIFKTLPRSERILYHSHWYAVKSGVLVLPGVPKNAELNALAAAANTYGKVVDYWHSYQTFPLGPPRLAYGLADDSQLNSTILDEMDKALNLDTTWQQRRQERSSLQAPEQIDGASDYLTSGTYPQYVIKMFDLPNNTNTGS